MKKSTTIFSLITTIIVSVLLYPFFMFYLFHNEYLFNKLDLPFTIPIIFIFMLSFISLLYYHIMLLKDIDCLNSINFKNIHSKTELLETIIGLPKCSLSSQLKSLCYISKSSNINGSEIRNHISNYIIHRGDSLKFSIGIFILFGLLGTFLGLIISLKNIEWIFKDSNVISNLSISFEGIALAFGTSICGIFSSISLRFSVYLYSSNSRKLYNNLHTISFRHIEPIILVTPHDLLTTIFTESFNRMMAEVMKDILQEIQGIVKDIYQSSRSIENNMEQYSQIIKSLSNSANNIENVSKGFSDTLNYTFFSISKNTEFTQQITEHFNTYKAIIDELKNIINNNFETFSMESLQLSTTVQTVIDNHTKKVELFNKDVNKNFEIINEHSQYFNKSISKLDELLVHVNNNNHSSKEFFDKSIYSLSRISESSEEYLQRKDEILEFQKSIIKETRQIINEFSKNLDYIARVITRKDNKFLEVIDNVTDKLKPFIRRANVDKKNVEELILNGKTKKHRSFLKIKIINIFRKNNG